MVTPPGKDGKANPDILTAAAIAGVDRVFLMGGAQAVGALAYGTASVPAMDKIVGPGNIFVATAKKASVRSGGYRHDRRPQRNSGDGGPERRAGIFGGGPDEPGRHDRLASAILLTTSREIGEKTCAAISRQLEKLSRKEMIESALDNYGAIFLCDCTAKMVELANRIAPEHLEVMMENPMEYIGRLDNAGSVFLGRYAPEPLGDYLPAPTTSCPPAAPLGSLLAAVGGQLREKSSFIYYTEEALREASGDIVAIANREGLTAHANSITVRFEDR